MGLNAYDYGARNYDPAIGRFFNMDRFSEKYADNTPFHYTRNNPVRYREMKGDSIWVTMNTVDNNTNFTIHFRGKVLNTSDRKIDMKSYASSVQSKLAKALTGKNGNITFSSDVQITAVSSAKEVNKSDHLLAIVDDVTGSSAKGGDAGGIANMNGKIAYVESSGGLFTKTPSFEFMTDTGVHELGHNFGLQHNWTDQFSDDNSATNYMSYSLNPSGSFSIQQLNHITGNANDTLNQGSPTQKATESSNNYFYNTSTNSQPYDFNVKKGDIIPTIINN